MYMSIHPENPYFSQSLSFYLYTRLASSEASKEGQIEQFLQHTLLDTTQEEFCEIGM